MSLPLGRVVREWRRILVPVAVLALANVGLHVFVIYPVTLRTDAAERRAERARETSAAAEREHAQAQALVRSSQEADRDLQRFHQDVLPTSLAAARRMTYTRLAELARGTNLLYDRRSFEPDTRREGTLHGLRIAMDLEGDYRDVRDFIFQLESSPEFLVLEQVTLTGSDEEAPLTLSIQLATYFPSEADGR